MSWLQRVTLLWRHPVRVSITLIVLAFFWCISYLDIKKSSLDEFKTLQPQTSLQSSLKTSQGENSSLTGPLTTVSLLPLAYNVQEPEGSGDEDIMDFNQENAVVRRLRKRREKVLEFCRSGEFQDCNTETVLTNRMFFFHHHGTSVCTVLKSASSTWREHFRRVNGVPPYNESIYNDHIRKAFLQRPIEEVVKDVKSSSKILTVRHPLARLVSDFCIKYKNGKMTHRPKAEKEYRKKIAGTSWAERFYQFWLPALFANNMVPPDTHHVVGMKAPVDPNVLYSEEEYEQLYRYLQPKITFVQFLKFILKTYEEGNPNDHWKSHYNSCCPCHFDYDYITKVETLSEDLEYIFKKLDIPADPQTSLNHKNKSDDNIHSYFEYYLNVPTTLRRDIYKYIQKDMDLFEYELPMNFLSD